VKGKVIKDESPDLLSEGGVLLTEQKFRSVIKEHLLMVLGINSI
jgi:hypothetical protein